MKRKFVAIALLTMLLGTSGVVFAQSHYAVEEQQIIASVQEYVKTKTEHGISVIRQSDLLDSLLALLAEGLMIAGLLSIVVTIHKAYKFSYSQALVQFVPTKEKYLRFSRDDVL